MTIINNTYKFIFVHIPKSAGTTITSTFSRYTNYCDLEIGGTVFGEQIQPAYSRRFGLAKHSSAKDIKALVGAVEWSKYFTFAFVRNPYARAFSTYNFLRKWESPNAEFNNKMKSFKSFDEFVKSGIWEETNGPDEIFRQQIHWLREAPFSNQLIVDYIGKVEMIDGDINKILSILDVNKMKLNADLQVPRLNKSTEPNDYCSMSDFSLEKIYDKYKQDFELLGYSKEIDSVSNNSRL